MTSSRPGGIRAARFYAGRPFAFALVLRCAPAARAAFVAVFALLSASGLAGCGGAGPSLSTLPPPGATPDPRFLRGALDDLGTAERDSFLVRRLRASGLTPVVERRFVLGSGAVVAFVPGRHPGRGRERVVVATASVTAAAALLEEARLMNARAAFTVAPERTVMVAFLPPGSGAAGLAAVLDAPLWTRPLTVAALVAGAGSTGAAYEAVGAARGVPVQLVAAPAGEPAETQGDVTEALALAVALRASIDAAANGAPAAPDVED